MAATNAISIGYAMSAPQGRQLERMPEHETFIVRCGVEGVRAMARIDQVTFNARRENYVSREQYEELLRLGIPHELIDAPSSYKLPIVKIRRR